VGAALPLDWTPLCGKFPLNLFRNPGNLLLHLSRRRTSPSVCIVMMTGPVLPFIITLAVMSLSLYLNNAHLSYTVY